jgi:hypothetical protein
MRKSVVFALTLLGLSLLFLPSLQAEDDAWSSTKTSSMQWTRGEYTSAALKPCIVGGDFISLPVKGGAGIPIKVSPEKVLVDASLNGKVDFLAAQGERSKPITVELEYENGDKAKYTFAIAKVGGSWAMSRQCGVSAKIEGTDFLFLDDNNNGIYGEEGSDGIYYGKKEAGCQFSHIVAAGGKLFEIELSKSGKELKYRPYAGQSGKVDILKDWQGKKSPDTIIVRGIVAGTVYFDIAGKGEFVLPVGSYALVSAELPDVTIKAGNGPCFNVEPEGVASVKWGHGLEVRASLTYDSFKQKIMLNPIPKVFGADGVEYIGKFKDDGKFKFKVTQTNANGQPVGKSAFWSQTVSGSGGG